MAFCHQPQVPGLEFPCFPDSHPDIEDQERRQQRSRTLPRIEGLSLPKRAELHWLGLTPTRSRRVSKFLPLIEMEKFAAPGDGMENHPDTCEKYGRAPHSSMLWYDGDRL